MGHSDWGSEKSTRSKWEWEVMRKCVYETGAVTTQTNCASISFFTFLIGIFGCFLIMLLYLEILFLSLGFNLNCLQFIWMM
jgi:hypothetical protein